MSFLKVTYQDLENSGIPFSSFVMTVDCQPRVVRDWKTRGIPFDHQVILHKFLVSRGVRLLTDSRTIKTNKIKELSNNSIPKNVNKIKYIAKKSQDLHIKTLESYIQINDLDEDGAPLVTITKSPARIGHSFDKIQQWHSPKITDDKTLVFDSLNYCSYVCNRTGEQFDYKRKGKKWMYVKSQSEIVAERYELQSIAREILLDADVPLRVCNCHRSMLAADVQVLQSVEHENTFFSGLMACGMVWQCPVDAPKISERRRVEAKHGLDVHKLRGGLTSFHTRTVPHTCFDSLDKVLSQFVLAEEKMRASRKYKDLKKLFGVIGTIKAYELTIGKNGWHVHVHEIFFHESEAAVKAAGGSDWLIAFQDAFYPLWAYYAEKAGFDTPSKEHGLQVQNGDFAAEYVAKYGVEPSQDFWTVDSEITSYHRKNSKSGLSPFDCLRQYRDTGKQFYADIFYEFAYTMFNRRARQLMWSPGLKKHFAVTEKTDEEIAIEEEDAAILLGRITRQQWKVIVNLGKRAQVLNIARELGAVGLNDFLNGINLILSSRVM